MKPYMLTAALLGLITLPVYAETIAGRVSVIDGDTIEIKGKRIRLFGIDAPEGRQFCTAPSGKAWRCGKDAAFALADRIGVAVVSCDKRDTDRYGRIIAVCRDHQTDLNAWMVSEGWAVAYRLYSRDYVQQEAQARKAGLGLWSGSFQMPWDWRKSH